MTKAKELKRKEADATTQPAPTQDSKSYQDNQIVSQIDFECLDEKQCKEFAKWLEVDRKAWHEEDYSPELQDIIDTLLDEIRLMSENEERTLNIYLLIDQEADRLTTYIDDCYDYLKFRGIRNFADVKSNKIDVIAEYFLSEEAYSVVNSYKPFKREEIINDILNTMPVDDLVEEILKEKKQK